VQAVFIADSFPTSLKAALLANATGVRGATKMPHSAPRYGRSARAIEANLVHATLGDGAIVNRQKPAHNDAQHTGKLCGKSHKSFKCH
jgi:hypothetical protein